MGMAEVIINDGFKASETLLGIETVLNSMNLLRECSRDSFKASETLLGIETLRSQLLG